MTHPTGPTDQHSRDPYPDLRPVRGGTVPHRVRRLLPDTSHEAGFAQYRGADLPEMSRADLEAELTRVRSATAWANPDLIPPWIWYRLDRLTEELNRRADPASPLVGRYFHTRDDGRKGRRQGKVTSGIGPGVYLVQWFSWLDGAPNGEAVVAAGDMVGWSFWQSVADWRDAGDDLLRDAGQNARAEAAPTVSPAAVPARPRVATPPFRPIPPEEQA